MGSKPTPGAILFAGVRPVSPSLRCTRKPEGLAPRQNRSGHAQGPRISLARRLSSVRVRGAPPFPDRPTAGRPAVNRSIQVRILVGKPMRRDRLVARTRRLSTGRPEFESPSRHHQAHVAQLDGAPDYGSGGCRFESCRVLHSCEQDSREATLLDQRVGEPGRPCLPWKQEIGGSNPSTLTNCPRSSAEKSGRLLSGGSGVRFTPRAPIPDGWPSGKAARC